jgi:type VI protein secretion system component VasK
MLRDGESKPYSLGRSQMAFWGILFLVAFLFVWVLTGTVEYVPPQALILIGISGATGLAAVAVDKEIGSKRERRLAELEEEQSVLERKKKDDPNSVTAEMKARLDMIPGEVEALKRLLQGGKSKGFWSDICSNESGPSFHRLQNVLWTMVLGAVFAGSVALAFSMPQFPDTLLVLMGISNGTYVGFKFAQA